MIFITKEVYDDLINQEVEACGLIGGIGDRFIKIYRVKNVDKRMNRFKMGGISKLFNLMKIFCSRCRNVSIYHVHDKHSNLSAEDLDNMLFNFFYIVVFNSELRIYKKIQRELFTSVVDVKFKVVEV